MTEELWQQIVTDLTNNPRDLQTIPLRGTGRWFHVSVDGSKILVENAESHTPSSNLAVPRKISRNEFVRMYPIHIRRENGEQVSQEAQRAGHNQVYIYSIFRYCGRM